MKITVIGTGYVGLVCGTCFAEMGNDVTCVDIDKEKIKNLKNGTIDIYEPGLKSMVLDNISQNRLFFTTKKKEALKDCQICFIAVGTPMQEDGSADLQHVLDVAKSIGENINSNILIVNKSTVPVGTANKVFKIIQNALDIRNLQLTFDVISNPEFLKEGDAIKDFMQPDRIIIGANNDKSIEIMHQLYTPFIHDNDAFISIDIKSAEMTKYAANSMLATKISFMNEISNICELVGANINAVRRGIGSDKRIGYSFINPGCGYGGSCFPKDLKALAKTAKDYGYQTRILDAVEAVNFDQKKVISNKIIKKFGENLSKYTFAVWGLSFKPNTDDMRDASAITVIKELTKRGAKINAYDPKAIYQAKSFYLANNSAITYCNTKYDALKSATALLLLTEWPEFLSPDFKQIKSSLNTPTIFDGRNQYDAQILNNLGFEYFQIGV